MVDATTAFHQRTAPVRGDHRGGPPFLGTFNRRVASHPFFQYNPTQRGDSDVDLRTTLLVGLLRGMAVGGSLADRWGVRMTIALALLLTSCALAIVATIMRIMRLTMEEEPR